MSAALFKQSLEIVDGISSTKNVPNKKTEKSMGSKRLPKRAEKKAFGYVLRNMNKGKVEKPKLTVEQAKKNIKNKKDKTDDNLKKLLLMSSIKLDQNITDKLIRKAQNGHNFEIQEDSGNKDDDKSVFTEEDFRNFEKELFCS